MAGIYSIDEVRQLGLLRYQTEKVGNTTFH